MVDAIVLAVAIAMDVTAVATACGAIGATSALTFRMAWLFAVFHIGMCALGWAIGATAEAWMSAWDHWVAFGLLAIIGGKMMWSAMRPEVPVLPASWGVLLALAVGTSIDAVAAGVTLPLIDAPEVLTIGLVGGVVFAFVNVGARIGARLGERFGRAFQIAGGATIVALGVKTLVTHLA